jgi:hypothetical protein
MRIALSNARTALVPVLLITEILCLSVERAEATTLICGNAHYGRTEAHVVVPWSGREAFISYIKAGFPDEKYPLGYGGGVDAGVDSDDSLGLSLTNFEQGAIIVVVDSKKPHQEFVFWIQTCDTKRGWRPFWNSVLRSVRRFPDAKVWKLRIVSRLHSSNNSV